MAKASSTTPESQLIAVHDRFDGKRLSKARKAVEALSREKLRSAH
jgi:hypothetical protein